MEGGDQTLSLTRAQQPRGNDSREIGRPQSGRPPDGGQWKQGWERLDVMQRKRVWRRGVVRSCVDQRRCGATPQRSLSCPLPHARQKTHADDLSAQGDGQAAKGGFCERVETQEQLGQVSSHAQTSRPLQPPAVP